jgi:hypothetical protein
LVVLLVVRFDWGLQEVLSFLSGPHIETLPYQDPSVEMRK